MSVPDLPSYEIITRPRHQIAFRQWWLAQEDRNTLGTLSYWSSKLVSAATWGAHSKGSPYTQLRLKALRLALDEVKYRRLV